MKSSYKATANNAVPSQSSQPTLQSFNEQAQRQPILVEEKELPDSQWAAPSTSPLLPDSEPFLCAPSDVICIPPCMLEKEPRLLDLLQNATSCPPCTPATLRELDLLSIQNNLNLRIDICYDHDLFFQPISRRTGDVKRIEAERYWLSLAAEFKVYRHNLQRQCTECSGVSSNHKPMFPKRLSTLFTNLREIVDMLTPESDRDEVANRLDVGLLMQQVEKGVLDIAGFGDWLTSLLTSHCAPMRDGAAQEVKADIRNGAEQGDAELLILGIEKLFGLLEAMKLDIANYQIRAFRYPLIEDTVPFQQDFFTHAIQNEQISISSSKRWYQAMFLEHQRNCSSSEKTKRDFTFGAFMHAMVRLCDARVKKIPSTFRYDQQRFNRLQEDLQDLIQIDHCLVVFNNRLAQLGRDTSVTASVRDALKSRIIYLTEDEDGNGGAISDHLDAIALELTQTVLSVTRRLSRDKLAVADNEEYMKTSRMLHQMFEQEEETRFGSKRFLEMLEESAGKYAREFLPMSTLEVSNAQRQWNATWTASSRGKESLLADWDDMSRRLAHIGVLHWRVWADLCYLDDETEQDMDSAQSSPTESDFFGDNESMLSSAMTLGSSDGQRSASSAAAELAPTVTETIDDAGDPWANVRIKGQSPDAGDFFDGELGIHDLMSGAGKE